MDNKLMKSPCNVSEIKNPERLNVDRSEWSFKRRWKISMNYKTDIFLTEEEKDYFVDQISKGKKIIRVGEVILTNKFLCIVPVGDKSTNFVDLEEYKQTPEEKEKALKKLDEIRDKFN